VIHIADVTTDPIVSARSREIATAYGWRSALAAPMLRDGRVIGAVVVTRRREGAFTEREIELIQTFADQAVIAVERYTHTAMTCPRCQATNRDGARFCRECGATFAAVCAACGARAEAGSKYFDSCGAPLSATSVQPTATSRFAWPQSYTPKHLAEKILTDAGVKLSIACRQCGVATAADNFRRKCGRRK
jgi:hypothetical protein